jgi:unsaturated chondroitin disaccharide hydrolase
VNPRRGTARPSGPPDLNTALRRALDKVERRLLGPDARATCDRLNYNDVGVPWLLYDCTGSAACATLGRRVFDRLARGTGWSEPGENNGFRIYYGAVLGYLLTGDERMLAEVRTGLEVTARIFDPLAGVFRGDAWIEGAHSTLVDTGATLNPFLWAAGREPRYRDMLDRHFRRAARDHVRPDGSTVQLVFLDPGSGETAGHRTYQGYDDASCWARGQAWALYGFAGAWEALREPLFRDTAARLAEWFLDHLPDDGVPYYDFLDPHIPDAPRDTSAAAIACAGLLRLAKCWSGAPRRYTRMAHTTLKALERDYLTPTAEGDPRPPGMLLGGCWGRFADEFLRRNAGWIHPRNTHADEYYVWKRNIVLPESGELFYGLGFFLEALHRLWRPDSGLLDYQAAGG